MKILVVDDDLFNRTLLSDMLASFGSCDTAESGAQAIALFEQALAAGEPYCLVTLDVVMPGISGMDVLKKLRELEAAQSFTPATIIMITSAGDADTILTSFDARCDSYLTKPVTRQALFDKLAFLGLAADGRERK